jgi:transcriptional regulator with GAF, ATPase, and Fis domain
LSPRSNSKFTVINCAGLSSGLIESELFGHVKGAFTGASHTRYGYFEVGNGGTLFLDEIGDLPLDLQSRLLRVLDTGEYNRVGDTLLRKTDVRVLCATNKNIRAMVREKAFRDDLFYRISGGAIELPPLRERREDIPLLARAFLPDGCCAISPEALAAISSYLWPGNVRQLKMTMLRLSGLAINRIITLEHVTGVLGIAHQGKNRPGENSPPKTYKEFKNSVLFEAEKQYFQSLMDFFSGNISIAAQSAGIDRKNFYEKLKKAGIKH